jgi:hypothetical protein
LPQSIQLLPSANHLGLTPVRIVGNAVITAARKLAGRVAEPVPAAERGALIPAAPAVPAPAEREALEPAARAPAEREALAPAAPEALAAAPMVAAPAEREARAPAVPEALAAAPMVAAPEVPAAAALAVPGVD